MTEQVSSLYVSSLSDDDNQSVEVASTSTLQTEYLSCNNTPCDNIIDNTNDNQGDAYVSGDNSEDAVVSGNNPGDEIISSDMSVLLPSQAVTLSKYKNKNDNIVCVYICITKNRKRCCMCKSSFEGINIRNRKLSITLCELELTSDESMRSLYSYLCASYPGYIFEYNY